MSPINPGLSEFGMKSTTFTGDSSTLKREAYLASLGLPDERQTRELVGRLIENVVNIKDETGACFLFCICQEGGREEGGRLRRWPATRCSLASGAKKRLADAPVLLRFCTKPGEFLLYLPGGKVVDTKGWIEGWEWTHGCARLAELLPFNRPSVLIRLLSRSDSRRVGLYGAFPDP